MRNSTRVAGVLMALAVVACTPQAADESAPSLNPVAPSTMTPRRGRR